MPWLDRELREELEKLRERRKGDLRLVEISLAVDGLLFLFISFAGLQPDSENYKHNLLLILLMGFLCIGSGIFMYLTEDSWDLREVQGFFFISMLSILVLGILGYEMAYDVPLSFFETFPFLNDPNFPYEPEKINKILIQNFHIGNFVLTVSIMLFVINIIRRPKRPKGL